MWYLRNENMVITFAIYMRNWQMYIWTWSLDQYGYNGVSWSMIWHLYQIIMSSEFQRDFFDSFFHITLLNRNHYSEIDYEYFSVQLELIYGYMYMQHNYALVFKINAYYWKYNLKTVRNKNFNFQRLGKLVFKYT